jgi:DnaJ-class molecular chaperone
VQRDPRYRKEGADLIRDLNVKLTDALLGSSYEIDTFDGKIEVKIPKGISHGELLRIKGKGIVIDEKRRGDLLLKVKINIPSHLSRKAKKLIEDLRSEGL